MIDAFKVFFKEVILIEILLINLLLRELKKLLDFVVGFFEMLLDEFGCCWSSLKGLL